MPRPKNTVARSVSGSWSPSCCAGEAAVEELVVAQLVRGDRHHAAGVGGVVHPDRDDADAVADAVVAGDALVAPPAVGPRRAGGVECRAGPEPRWGRREERRARLRRGAGKYRAGPRGEVGRVGGRPSYKPTAISEGSIRRWARTRSTTPSTSSGVPRYLPGKNEGVGVRTSRLQRLAPELLDAPGQHLLDPLALPVLDRRARPEQRHDPTVPASGRPLARPEAAVSLATAPGSRPTEEGNDPHSRAPRTAAAWRSASAATPTALR